KDVIHHTDRGISVHIDPVQRAARRGRHPTVGRSGRKLL
ncbi:hypothetical protein TMBG_01191, partial [Mycobacterium tuberculosis SUMu002]